MERKYKKIPVNTDYLELNNISTKSKPQWPNHFSVIKAENFVYADFIELYKSVGSRWGWTAFLLLSENEVLDRLFNANTHIYYIVEKNNTAGFFYLSQTNNQAEILYIGLLPQYIGKGLGKILIQEAIYRASLLNAALLFLHTCEFDHKNALNAYIKSGFKHVKSQTDWEFYPLDYINQHMTMTINERLEELRALMSEKNFDALVIVGTDPHISEYVPERWKTREWISGFSGSAGRVVITQEFAGLWTDSRYFLQAEKELGASSFELMKLKVPHTPEYIDWLFNHIKLFGNVAVDGKLVSHTEGTLLYNTLSQRKISVDFSLDFISDIWKNRPAFPLEKPYILQLKYAGVSVSEKIEKLHDTMKKNKFDFVLVSALDEIAWLLNIRGNDVAFNPLVYAYMLVSTSESILYIHPEKLNPELKSYFNENKIAIKNYEAIDQDLVNLAFGSRIIADGDKTNKYLTQLLPDYTQLITGISPVAELKAVKNTVEIENTKKAMIKDGVALTKFFRWVEEIAFSESETEYTLGIQLQKFRAEQDTYVSDSFEPIVGFNANGAIVHYSADKETASKIMANGILLVDSGGQYLEGTTDITRTIALGNFPEEAKKDFTLVLKGHVQLAMAVFPEGTAGYQLDLLARMPLWRNAKNYGHGTGHGVGYFLNVHEGPQSIRPRSAVHVAFAAGMITSNEPGYYPTGKYGIRTENLILCTKKTESADGNFLEFETISLFPIDRKLIAPELLSKDELNWLNEYHSRVYEELSPYLNKEEKFWLKEQTMKIS